MALKQYNPTTSGQRQLVNIDRSELWKGRPFRRLSEGLARASGRNNLGRITSRHRGGRHKRLYREIDFVRNKDDVVGTVERLEYDPNRTAFIALIKYADGEHRYILAPHKLKVGDAVVSGIKTDIKPGNCTLLKNIPLGTVVHNVELKIGKGGQLARSAGTSIQIMGRDGVYVILRAPSGEVRLIRGECRATIGEVSNADNQNRNYSKAGRMRWKGVRPQTRGIAMNPVDHPHGGRTNGGRHPCTPWGISTKGCKTRRNVSSDKYIVRRRK
ncbi:50S ribosomal protein L2 [Alphaproteobacteria bacterium]|nr:50S ribosomal protein L2 [Alphaproteobacteria bacterium]GHS96640.1 50S ribosomal protein L2 [Alphaproteobacteria bacterium]